MPPSRPSPEKRGLLASLMTRDAKRRRLQDQQDWRDEEHDDDWDEEYVHGQEQQLKHRYEIG